MNSGTNETIGTSRLGQPDDGNDREGSTTRVADRRTGETAPDALRA